MFEQICQQLEKQPTVEGITIVEIADFPDPLGMLLRLLVRPRSSTLSALAAKLSLTTAEIRVLGDLLVAKGLLRVSKVNDDGEPVYQVQLISTRGRKVPGDLLRALEDE